MIFHYRTAVPEDYEEMFRLDRICFKPPFNFRQETFRYLLAQDDLISVVAENEEGRLSGFILVEVIPPNESCVSTIDVRPDSRRFGLGRELMKRALQQAADRSLFKSYLQVYVENRGAIEFYKTLGYRVLRKLPSFYGYRRNGLLMFLDLKENGGLPD